jgi:hypothetical protein
VGRDRRAGARKQKQEQKQELLNAMDAKYKDKVRKGRVFCVMRALCFVRWRSVFACDFAQRVD